MKRGSFHGSFPRVELIPICGPEREISEECVIQPLQGWFFFLGLPRVGAGAPTLGYVRWPFQGQRAMPQGGLYLLVAALRSNRGALVGGR